MGDPPDPTTEYFLHRNFHKMKLLYGSDRKPARLPDILNNDDSITPTGDPVSKLTNFSYKYTKLKEKTK